MAIQSKTGGNLAEALNNLSKVLRDRKKMKAKITCRQPGGQGLRRHHRLAAVLHHGRPDGAQSRPISIRCGRRRMGNIMLVGSGIWMLTGVLVMRKMINFDF